MFKEIVLSEVERGILLNQHKILSLLVDEEGVKKHHEEMVEIYESGYEYEYCIRDLNEPLDVESCKLVYKIINMYDDLNYAWNTDEAVKEKVKARDVIFSGFDLNDPVETRLYSYAKFLILEQMKFHETGEMIRKDVSKLNSHGFGPKLSGYIDMLNRYSEVGNSIKTVEDVLFVVNRFSD